MAEKRGKMNFEKALARLEEIVEKLDEGGLPLDKSMKLFEEGQKLARLCGDQLDSADRQIQLLVRSQDGAERSIELGEEEDIDGAVGEALDADD